MDKEYKDFLEQVFHAKDHDSYEPDYYSWRYRVVREEDNKITLELDDDFLEKPIHDLLLNMMEYNLMITKLVIGIIDPNDYDSGDALYMDVSVIPCA